MSTRGRPLVHKTDEARAEARAASKAKSKNITVDADIQDALNAVADDFEGRFGFRPTLSQTIRHLIKEARK